MKDKNKTHEKEVDPNSFYKEIDGIYNHPKRKIEIKIKRSLEDIHRKKEAQKKIKQENMPTETMPPEVVQKQYEEEKNKDFDDSVKIYNKSSCETLLIILIGVLVFFGLFFVWGVSSDKFKTDLTCPDYECPQAQLSCPNIDLSRIKQPACICNQTCPESNYTKIIDAINSLNISNDTGGS